MKKILALVLSILLAFSCFGIAACAASCDCGNTPIVFVNGINSRDLILDRGTENAKVVFPFSADDVIGIIKDNIGAFWDALDGDISAENEAIIVAAVEQLLEGVEMNDDGTSKYNVSPDWDITNNDVHKSGGHFTFIPDWRIDPMETAEQLKAFIDHVKELTGHDTIKIIGFSQGAIFLNAYLSLYGYDGIEACVWNSGAMNGLEMVGQLWTEQIHVNSESLIGFLNESIGNSFGDNILSLFAGALLDSGVVDNVLNITNKICDTVVNDKVIRDCLIGTVAKMPAMWAFLDDNYYELAKEKVFCNEGDTEKYAELISKIDNYHYNVQVKCGEIMDGMRDACGRIGVIAKYNRYTTPLVDYYNIQSDGLIDTVRESCGATCADIGTTLGDDYVQAIDDGHNHVSADNMIDASTCRYPENTWFIKNLHHSSNGAYVDGLTNYILNADHQVDVFENEEYPQFANFNVSTGEVSPLTEENANLSAADKTSGGFLSFIKRIFDMLRTVLDMLTSFFR